MKQSATLARLSKKTVAFLAAATTLLAGLSLATAAPQQASAATRDSYADTIGQSDVRGRPPEVRPAEGYEGRCDPARL